MDNLAEKIGLSKALLWEIENRSVENLDIQILNVIIKELSITVIPHLIFPFSRLDGDRLF